MNHLLLHSSIKGHTQSLCEKIAAKLQGHSFIIAVDEYKKHSINLDDYDTITLGASIYYGHFRACVYDFINEHHKLLNRKKTALFTVNLTARKADKNTAQTNPYTQKLIQKIAWHPQLIEVFAGKLDYPRYNFFDRTMIRFIMYLTHGETDKKAVIDYTDYAKLEKFAEKINRL